MHKGPVEGVVFSADGLRLVTASHDAPPHDSEIIVNQYLLRSEDLGTEASSRLARNLTRQEWRQYIPGEPYRKTCPNLPEGP